MVRILLACICMLAAMSAQAVNKCTDANGNITYSDTPCPKTAEADRVTIQRAPTPVAPRPALSASDFDPSQCGRPRRCYEIRTCEEAQLRYHQCNQPELDRDRDGIACDELCEQPEFAVSKPSATKRQEMTRSELNRRCGSHYDGSIKTTKAELARALDVMQRSKLSSKQARIKELKCRIRYLR